MKPLRLAAPLNLAVILCGSAVSAQTVAVEPSQLTQRTLASPAGAPPRGLEAMFSLRVSFGAGVSAMPQEAGAFTLRGTIGSRVFFPTGNQRGWIVGPDAGIDRTWGMGDRDATLLSLGAAPGYLWGLTGVAWAPRVLYGWRDDGDTVWGVRNGVRVLIVGGVFDLEVAHQYVTGALGGEHQAQFTVGMDVGLFGHVLSQLGRRPPRGEGDGSERGR